MATALIDSGRCAECGSLLPSAPPGGLCPCCMLKRFVPPGAGISTEMNSTLTGQPVKTVSERIRYFGDYELQEQIACGGMGVVYKARQISLNRVVALKMIIAGQLASEQEVRRFRTETEAAASLDHPNIVPLYEVGEHEGRQFFTMKLLEGGSLEKRVGSFVGKPQLAAKVMADLARAVYFAHQRGILHRDLKPANILFDAAGVPHVSDFGLAKNVDESQGGNTHTGVLVGTPAYMSPEQASGQAKRLTTASDTFSLGVILYQLLAGHTPFCGESIVDILDQIRFTEPEAPRQRNVRIDRDLEIICLKCLRKEPEKRYTTADLLAADLERWLRGEPILARATPPVERAYKWVRRRPAVALSGLLACALVFAVAASVWHNTGLKRRTEAQKLAERQKLSSDAARTGAEALKRAAAAVDSKDRVAYEQELIDAEDEFRAALYEMPDNQPALDGLRDVALHRFRLALDDRAWRHAQEKLKLARSAGLAQAEFAKNFSLLQSRQSERVRFIRQRVKELMDDADGVPRKIMHEAAANELISLKDPATFDLLLPCVADGSSNRRKLAMAALTWYGDRRAIPVILPYIHPQTPKETQNTQDVQAAAICAICVLAADADVEAYNAVHDRLWREPGKMASRLSEQVRSYYEPFALRMAPQTAQKLDVMPDAPASEWYNQAARYYEAEQFQQAVSYFDKALEKDPRYALALVGRGLAQRAAGDMDAAGADFDAAIEMDSELAAAYVNRAQMRVDQNDAKPAIADCNTALALEPKNALAYVVRGRAKHQLRDVDAAIDDLSKAIELEPETGDAYLNRSNCYYAKRNIDAALADCTKAIELNPRSDAAYLQRGALSANKSDWDAALTDVTRAMELNPGNARAYFLRGRIWYVSNNMRKALPDLNKAIDIDPREAGYYILRGNIKRERGNFAPAMVDYNFAAQMTPNDPEIYFNRGQTLIKRKDLPGAMSDFNKTVTLDPKYADAYFYRANLKRDLGDVQGAIADYELTLTATARHTNPATLAQAARDRIKQLEEAK